MIKQILALLSAALGLFLYQRGRTTEKEKQTKEQIEKENILLKDEIKKSKKLTEVIKESDDIDVLAASAKLRAKARRSRN